MARIVPTKICAGLLALGIATAGLSDNTRAETKLTFASFLPASHPVSKWTEGWIKEMETKSNNELKFNFIPGAQLGPTPNYFDIARRGQADITWFLHGGTPGRFPLTELSNLPFLFCSAEQATKVVNDKGLRDKYLDPEHKGVKVLMLVAHVPGHVWTAKKPIRSIDDFRGAAIRPPSRTIGALITALGARSVGLPPNVLAENMQKGTIDGTFMDYPAGAFAFKLGPVTQFITEAYAYTTSLGIAMNANSYNKLPKELRAVFDAATKGREKSVAGSWDNFDAKAKGVLQKNGTEIVRLSADETKKLRTIGDQVSQKWVKELDDKGLSGSAVLAQMKSLAKETQGTSANFCTN